jgi:hypothetical protein
VSAVLGVIPVEADHHRLYAGLSRADPEAHVPAGREDHISPLLKRLHESATIEHPPSMRAFALAAYALLQSMSNGFRLPMGAVIPCSNPAQQRKGIIQKRVALLA